MKKSIVLYVTSQEGSWGFFMENPIIHGVPVGIIPPAMELPDGPEGENPDQFAMDFLTKRLGLSKDNFISEPMGEREQQVTDPKTGRTDTRRAFRYSVTINKGQRPRLTWQDPDGHVHKCKWSQNAPY